MGAPAAAAGLGVAGARGEQPGIGQGMLHSHVQWDPVFGAFFMMEREERNMKRNGIPSYLLLSIPTAGFRQVGAHC